MPSAYVSLLHSLMNVARPSPLHGVQRTFTTRSVPVVYREEHATIHRILRVEYAHARQVLVPMGTVSFMGRSQHTPEPARTAVDWVWE
ncbi:hypothetical protein BKA82DRAFT_741264 [Pisolithus tinctorius]|uniref:Uncharacterized protein n=1 Tax=Pisolithus tinctorius Marx 270 TaxID=870435 RepID=A0A0C3P127_PISTI|nr:hypothetical protein BKA82DRAFT_741264 [Pisolithus tinctorius]KIO01069.1 hypothetical protein M404DRAFT_741264 [Pisolithus tinctorius Marx 270]